MNAASKSPRLPWRQPLGRREPVEVPGDGGQQPVVDVDGVPAGAQVGDELLGVGQRGAVAERAAADLQHRARRAPAATRQVSGDSPSEACECSSSGLPPSAAWTAGISVRARSGVRMPGRVLDVGPVDVRAGRVLRRDARVERVVVHGGDRVGERRR